MKVPCKGKSTKVSMEFGYMYILSGPLEEFYVSC